MTLQEFIDDHIPKIENIETASRLAWWNLATTGDEKYAKQFQDTHIDLRKIYSSNKDYHSLMALKGNPDPLLNRQRILLLHHYKENQISPDLIEQIVKLETEIEATYTNFRPIVNNTPISNNDLKKILVESNNSAEREQAWSSSKQIGEQVEQQVRHLISLRNESARKAGFTDFYSMSLELQELDQKKLFDLLSELDNLTTPHWKTYKSRLDQKLAERYGITATDLRPWHYQDPFFQEAPTQELDLDPFYKDKNLVDIGIRFYKAIGLPVEDILERSDLYERDKKNQHAFCTCIDQKQDVRTLCNMRDNEYWMGTLLHELGHAVYDKYIDQSLPYVLRNPAHTSTTEAIAMLFGRLSKDGDFLQQYCGVDEQKAQEIGKLAKQQIAANLLVFTRWVLVMTHFERAMYQQPNVDLNKFWWDCVEKFQWVKRVPERHKPDWASKLHLACAPVYYQNYILGEMTASQLKFHLNKFLERSNEKFLTSPKVGSWLKNSLFRHGATSPWDQTLKLATNEPLNPYYFSKDLK